MQGGFWISASRFYVNADIYELFAAAMAHTATAAGIGRGLDARGDFDFRVGLE